MKIATLQFDPHLGAVEQNIDRANTLLSFLRPSQVDLLVLPELAFTGYNFPSVEAITPYLEPTADGPTTKWAVATAQRLECHVIVGYPEISNPSAMSENGEEQPIYNYNSTITVSPAGGILTNYRKSFLYYTDQTWASEGPSGPDTRTPNGSLTGHSSTRHPNPFFCGPLGRLGNVGLGICMDINPYQFLAPWREFEFANAMLRGGVELVVLSMAWLTRLLPQELEEAPSQPDMETVAYWLERFWPFIEGKPKEDVVVVFANRCGTEGSVVPSTEPEEAEKGDLVCYAGSSTVMKFQDGEARMFERSGGGAVAIMGKGEEGVLVVDTSKQAGFSLMPAKVM